MITQCHLFGGAALGVAALGALVSGCHDYERKAVANQPPVVAAKGPDAPVAAGAQVTLDGRSSADPEGAALSYRWTQVLGDPVALQDAGSALASFIAPARRQRMLFSLVVSDGRIESAAGYADVTIDFNAPPVADAGSPREVATGGTLLLEAGGTDPEGDLIVAYEWKVAAVPPGDGPAPVLSGAQTAFPLFSPQRKGLYTLTLEVTDERGAKSLPATLLVSATNGRPVADAGEPAQVRNHGTATLTGRALDPDADDDHTFRWTLREQPAGARVPGLAGESSPRLDVTPHAKGSYVFELVVADALASSAAASVTLVATNNPPTFSGSDRITEPRAPVVLDTTGDDPDGDPVTLRWRVKDAGGRPFTLEQTAAGAVFTPGAAGTYTLGATPNDGTSDGAETQVLVVAVENQPPVAAARAMSAIVTAGESVTLDGNGSTDPDGATLRYRWRQVLGDTVAIQNAGSALASFVAPARRQRLLFELTVSDGRLDSAPAYVDLTVDFNEPPVAATGAAREVATGDTILLEASGTDPEGDALTGFEWKVTAVPPGPGPAPVLSGADTAFPLFTPLRKGLYTLSLRVTDSRGAQGLPATLVISALNARPLADPGPPSQGRNHAATVLRGAARDADAEDEHTFRWSLREAPAGAPAPVLAGESSAELSVTPHAKGRYLFELVVADAEISSEPATVTFLATNNAPTATAADRAVSNGSPLLLEGAGDDPDGDTVTLRWRMKDAGGKPFALERTAAGTVFTPAQRGRYVLAVTPNDGIADGPEIDVRVDSTNRPPMAVPSIRTGSLTTGETFTVSAAGSSDPDGATTLTYRWSVAQGQATIVSGATAETATVRAGAVKETIELELVATDEAGAASAAARLSVLVDNTPPEAVPGADGFAGEGDPLVLDGSGSVDAESSTGLRYTWRCLTHPSLTFAPGPQVASPTVTVPAGLGTTVRFGLVVSDGRASSTERIVAFEIVPGNVKQVFVRSDAACTTDCDGTREKPFRTITEGAALSAMSLPAREVLVATGVYGASRVPGGVPVTGSCEPVRWGCTPAQRSSVVRAATTDRVALEVFGRGLTSATVRGFDIREGIGEAAVSTSPCLGFAACSIGLLCSRCDSTFEDLRVEGDSSAPAALGSYAVLVSNTVGPVKFSRLDVLSGQTRYNYAFMLHASSNVRVDSSSMTSRASIRSAYDSQNVLVALADTGTGIVVERNRFLLELGATAATGNMIYFGTRNGALLSGNLFRQRGSTPTGRESGIRIDSGVFEPVQIVHNTFLGSPTALADGGGRYAAISLITSDYNGYPLHFVNNNVIQGYGSAVYAPLHPSFEQNYGRVRLRGNSIHPGTLALCGEPTRGVLSCPASASVLSGTPAIIPSNGTSILYDGVDNRIEDCLLKAPADGDAHLTAGSACIDSALTDLGLASLDLDGDARPLGAAADRGADEFVSSSGGTQ